VTFTASALLVSWAAILLLAFAVAGLLARVYRLEQAVAGPAALPTPVGGPLPLPGVERGPVLLLFVDDGCGSCEQAAAAVADLEARDVARLLWRVDEPEAFAALEVTATPHAVVADADLRVVASLAVGSPARLAEAIEILGALETGAPA